MMRRARLELFDRKPEAEAEAPVDTTVVLPGDALEEAKLESFEKGYKAGWDDSIAAQADEARQLQQDVGRALQGLTFTYHEARGHLLRALAPLLEQICTRVLPEMAHAALGGLVREALLPLADTTLERPVTLLLNPAARPIVEEALAAAITPPITLVEEASLPPGQLFLRWDEDERRIDVDEAVEAIRTAVSQFFTETEEELRRHG